MSGILPFACDQHRVWSPVANKIHAAIWDRVGLEIVQGFVREWASNWVNEFNAGESAQQESLARVRQELHYPDDRTLPLIAFNLPYDRQRQQAIDAVLTWQHKLPALPLPPSHSPRSLAEKWAGLAAVHDVFDLTGDKVLPWPLPEDDQDLGAFAEWIRGEGGAYQVLMRKVSELPATETYVDPIRRWLDDVKKGSAPAVEPLDAGGGDAKQPPQPLTPKVHLASWREILIALGMLNNSEDRQKVDRLNETYNGPIKKPGQGKQPFADKIKLLEWWNGLEELVESQADRLRDAKETVKETHAYGRKGEAVPEISGGVKKRRKDWQP